MIKKVINCMRNIYVRKNVVQIINNKYFKRFKKNAFVEKKCDTFSKYEAVIIKMYHSIEKGLSYKNYKAGFGRNSVFTLISTLEAFEISYGTEHFCYKTALSVLHEYVNKNKAHGHSDKEVENRIASLKGTANDLGGVVEVHPFTRQELDSMNFPSFVKSRRSIRSFSDTAVDIDLLNEALNLAQYTPSACNRQGWKTIIISNKTRIKAILENQNGNRGFGEGIDKLLLIVFDLNCFSRSREHYQGFIDGGMYAMNVLHSLHYYGVGSVPLSASLTPIQERNLRNILNLEENLMPVMFIGTGMYPEKAITTRSERKEASITLI